VESKWKSRYNVVVPLFSLPDPPPYRLTNAPLVQALAQVRYPLVAAFETLAGVALLQELLAEGFPYMEQERVQEIAFVVGPVGPAAGSSAETVNWKFTNDEGLLLAVSAGSATLSAGAAYGSVSEFASAFELLLKALAQVRIPRCDRVGVRYLSVAAESPGDDRSWRDWFRPELLGWVGSDVLEREFLSMAINQVQLTHPPRDELAGSPADIQAVVRHGAVPAGSSLPGVPPIEVSESSYLLDIDVFVVGAQPFDPAMITDQFWQFHSQIDRFFHWSLSETGKEHFELSYIEG